MTRPRITEVPSPPTLTEVHLQVQFLRGLYSDTLQCCLDAGSTEHAALREAQRVWRSQLPALDSRTGIQCFIACVASGFADRILDADDTRVLLYGAQMALATIGGCK